MDIIDLLEKNAVEVSKTWDAANGKEEQALMTAMTVALSLALSLKRIADVAEASHRTFAVLVQEMTEDK